MELHPELRSMVGAGGIEPGSQVAAAGSNEWRELEGVAELGAAARLVGQPPVARSPASPRWTQASVVLLSLLLAAVGASTFLVNQRIARAEEQYRGWHEAQLTSQREERESQRTAELAWQRGAPRKISEVSHECVATMSEVNCSFTNLGTETVTTCAQGLLMQKDAAGVRLYSAPVCSGPVAPRQTVSKGSYWDGGRANDVCRSTAGYLDWQKCDFAVIDFEGTNGK